MLFYNYIKRFFNLGFINNKLIKFELNLYFKENSLELKYTNNIIISLK